MDFEENIFPKITSGAEFESMIVTMLTNMGIKAYKTGGDDGGVDIIAKCAVNKVDFTFFIQCKFFNKSLGKHPIQEVFSGSHYYNEPGLPVLITNNEVSYGARLYARRLNVEIISRDEFKDILAVKRDKTAEVITQYNGLMGIIIGGFKQDADYISRVANNNKMQIPDDKETARLQITNDFDEAEECEREAAMLEAKASKYKQRSLAIQKVIALKSLDYG